MWFTLAYAMLSDIMPFLPTKANGVAQLILNVLKALFKGPPGPPTLLLKTITTFVLFTTFTGCAYMKRAIIDAEQCAAPAALKEIGNLTPAVTAILMGGAADWRAQLAALESMGPTFVVCTVEAVVRDLAVKAEISATWTAQTSANYAVERGHMYLASYGL